MTSAPPLSDTLVDILVTFARGLWASGGFLLGWAVLFALLILPAAQRRWHGLPTAARRVLQAVLLGAALVWVWHLASLFDDAYISLRYARNLVRGNGLVWNVGEAVEGYTNFLWTILLGGGMAAGFDGPQFAIAGCMLAFAAELVLVTRLSRLLTPEATGPTIPFAALLLGASYTFATYGTSGMETMLTALLLTAALERAIAGSPGWAGLFGILGVLNHPDFALLYAGLGVATVLKRPSWRVAVRYGASFVLVYAPYFAWRYHYYGDLMPNTYYAKSANLGYFSQGLVYVLASGLACGLIGLVPLAAHALWRRPDHLLSIFTIFGVVPFFTYVTKIGGDFMIGRLFVGVLPLFAVLAERGVRDIIAEGKLFPRWAMVGLLALAVTPVHLIGWRQVKWYLSDERTWFALDSFSPRVVMRREPDRVQAYREMVERGVHVTVGEIMIGMSGYESDLPMIDEVGLTDWTVAHQPLLRRGRPGHEKLATTQYLRKRDVRLSYAPLYPEAYTKATLAYVHHAPFYLGRYEPGLVKILRSVPDAVVPDVPALIDDYIAEASQTRPDTLEQDAAFFDGYYFLMNRDPERRARLKALLADSGTNRAGRNLSP